MFIRRTESCTTFELCFLAPIPNSSVGQNTPFLGIIQAISSAPWEAQGNCGKPHMDSGINRRSLGRAALPTGSKKAKSTFILRSLSNSKWFGGIEFAGFGGGEL